MSEIPQVPKFCPFCLDTKLVEIHDAELYQGKGETSRRVSTARAYRCSNWHVFVVFQKVAKEAA